MWHAPRDGDLDRADGEYPAMSPLPQSIQARLVIGGHAAVGLLRAAVRIVWRMLPAEILWTVYWLAVLVMISYEASLLWSYYVIWRDGGFRLR
jgi:hypothetical protein